MRALVLSGAGVKLDAARRRPVPGSAEALIRVVKAGAGALDVEIARGLHGFSGVLGHEFVGVVESAASPSAALTGRRVVASVNIVCGQCDLCAAGLSTHCRHRSALGMIGRDGCLAEYIAVPARNLVPVPDDVDDARAVFAVPLASAVQASRQLTLEGKPYITVLGDGPLGLLMVQVMAKLNASVRLVGRYSEHLSLCEKWGIKHRHVDDVGRRADQDVVVDCTGSPSGLELAMSLVRPRGKIVLKTMTAPPRAGAPGLDLTPLVTHEIELIGSRCGPVGEALGMIAREEVEVVSLIGKRVKLDAGPAILEAAARPGALKVIIDV